MRRTLALTGDRVRLLGGVLLIGCLSGCASTQPQAESEHVRFSNRWLKTNVTVRLIRAERNHESDLFEVDAEILTDKLQKGHDSGYRVVVRTLFYRDSRDQTVDESAWMEILLQPGLPGTYASTSLVAANKYTMELAYPEEVGLR